MRKKLIEIHCCSGCYHLASITPKTDVCLKTDRRCITTDIFVKIPNWCPLPDAENEAVGEAIMALQKFVAQYELGSALDIPGYIDRVTTRLEATVSTKQ